MFVQRKNSIWNLIFAVCGCLAIVVLLCTAEAQTPSASPSGNSPNASAPLPQRELFQEAIWQYLTSGPTAYRRWTSWPGTNGFFAGEIPHGPQVKLYANRMAAFYPDQLPYGSILVLENYNDSRTKLTSLSVMYRVRNYDPAHFDWYWIEYLPDGRVVKSRPEFGRVPMAGQVQNCIECHQADGGEDFVYVND